MVLVSFLFFGLIAGLKAMPSIRDYYRCYQQAYKIYDERGLVMRQANGGEGAICQERKTMIIKGLLCLQTTEGKVLKTPTETKILKQIARAIQWGPKDLPQMVTEHNVSCPDSSTAIQFDPRTNTWF